MPRRGIPRLAVLIFVALASTFCASRKTATTPAETHPVQRPSTRDIESLIERGCFRCLTDALNLARERGASPLAFEAATLLTLRARELGMPDMEWLGQARELAAADSSWAAYLDMVAAVPPDPLSGRRDD